MTFWDIFIPYVLINAIGCIFIFINCISTVEDEFWDIFVFPKLIRWLRESLNIVGTIIVTILFTICFFPALIIGFFIYLVCFIVFLIGAIFVALFARKD